MHEPKRAGSHRVLEKIFPVMLDRLAWNDIAEARREMFEKWRERFGKMNDKRRIIHDLEIQKHP